jgi:hypothetical protein
VAMRCSVDRPAIKRFNHVTSSKKDAFGGRRLQE